VTEKFHIFLKLLDSGAGRRARHECGRATSCLNDGHGGPPHCSWLPKLN
jgi:hypothetical protein